MRIGFFIALAFYGQLECAQSSKHASEVAKLQQKEAEKKARRQLGKSKSLPNLKMCEKYSEKEDVETQAILNDILSRKMLSKTLWQNNIVIPDGREMDQEMYWDFVLEAYAWEDQKTLDWLSKKAFFAEPLILMAQLYNKKLYNQSKINCLETPASD